MANPFLRRDLALDPRRAPAAVCAGAALGAALCVAAVLALLAGPPGDRGRGGDAGADALLLIVVVQGGVTAFFVWALGIVLAGGPVWWALDRIGARGWATALLAGAALPAAAMAALGGRIEVPAMAPIGAAVGWTIWRVAYRSAPGGESEAIPASPAVGGAAPAGRPGAGKGSGRPFCSLRGLQAAQTPQNP